MSAIVQNSISVAAGATNQNVLQGTRMQFAPQQGMLNLYSTGSALGLTATMFVANSNPLQESAINAQNRMPVVPDDLTIGNIPIDPQEMIQLKVTNSTAGALTFFYRVEIQDWQMPISY